MDDEEIPVWAEHLLADVHDMAKQLAEMYGLVDEFRPLLKVLKSGTAVEKAGLARLARKAAKSG